MINLDEIKAKTREKKYDEVWDSFLIEYKEMLKNFLKNKGIIKNENIEYTFSELLNMFYQFREEKYAEVYDILFNMYIEEDINYIELINYSIDKYILIKKVLES